MASQNDAAMKALGIKLPANAIPLFVLNGFLLGIAAIWLYAAARPRYGASAKTAVLTALGVWVIGYALPNFGMGVQGLFPVRLLAVASAVGLAEIIVASNAGAAIYKEA